MDEETARRMEETLRDLLDVLHELCDGAEDDPWNLGGRMVSTAEGVLSRNPQTAAWFDAWRRGDYPTHLQTRQGAADGGH